MHKCHLAALLSFLTALASTAQAQIGQANQQGRSSEYGTYVPGVSPREDNPLGNFRRQEDPNRSYHQYRSGRSQGDEDRGMVGVQRRSPVSEGERADGLARYNREQRMEMLRDRR